MLTFFHSQFQSLRTHWRVALAAVLLTACLSGTAYLFLGGALLSRRNLLLALVGWVAFSPLLYAFFVGWLFPRLRCLTSRQAAQTGLAAGLFALLILLAYPVEVPAIPFLFPVHTLELQIPQGALPAGENLELRWFYTAYGDVSFSQLALEGAWQTTGNGLALSEAPAALAWRGRAGDEAVLTFAGLSGGSVQVAWDGQPQTLDLASPGDVVTRRDFSIPLYNRVLSSLLVWGALAGLLAVLLIVLVSLPVRPAPQTPARRGRWLGYALPMLLVWTLALLAFWPGAMSEDSVDQWAQVLSGRFNDWHPVFHTLTIWLLTRAWLSPAVVALAQILSLALTAAWGLSQLQRLGLPRWLLWVFGALFALLPANQAMVITLWKDIPYSIALFILFILFLKILTTRAGWVARPWRWLALAAAALGVSLYRLNGPPVAFACLLLLLLVYRRYWKYWLGSLLFTLLLWAGVQGPLYNALDVARVSSANANSLLLHHLGAYVEAGADFTPQEAGYLDALIPLDEWDYNCYSLVALLHSPVNDGMLLHDRAGMLRVLWSLFRRDPGVAIRHRLCASSIVWRLDPTGYMFATYFSVDDTGQPAWLLSNTLGLQQDSHLPRLARRWVRLFVPISVSNRSLPLGILWRPGFYLYLSLFCIAAVTIRLRDRRWLLLAAPLLAQTAVMLVLTSVQDFRFHYGISLIGVYCLGLLFTFTAGKGDLNKRAG